MAEAAIGTASAIVGLISTAITLIQQIRKARDRVKGASDTLANLSRQLENLEQSLSLVREEEALQTPAVAVQVQNITVVANELNSFLGVLAAKQQKRSAARLIDAMKSGDKDDQQLADILDRLDRERDVLGLRISVAQVGVVGNLKDGFHVAMGVLTETNEKVHEILGTKLALADRLRDRAPQQTDGTIALDTTDAEALGLLLPSEGTTTSGPAATGIDETSIYDNITVGQARIITGNVGVEKWYRRYARKTTIARNKFGGEAQIITSDVAGEAATTLIEKFFEPSQGPRGGSDNGAR